jgi:hypothetical protein
MTDDSKLAQQILDYLERRSAAGDTLEGIASWWIQYQRVSESVTIVYQALQELRACGVVLERKSFDGKTLYYLSSDL